MVKIFLFFSDFGRGYLRIWPICNFRFFKIAGDTMFLSHPKFLKYFSLHVTPKVFNALYSLNNVFKDYKKKG